MAIGDKVKEEVSEYKELLEVMQAAELRAWQTLVALLDSDKDDIRLSAVKLILERRDDGDGKPLRSLVDKLKK